MRRSSSPGIFSVLTVLLLATLLASAVSADTAAGAPALNVRSDATIDLAFPEPTSLVNIYRALGEALGIQVLFDPKMHDSKTVIELRDVTAMAALGMLNQVSGQFFTVLDEKTVLIAEDTPQNRRNYEKHVIRTFRLENIQLKTAMTMLRSLIGLKYVAATEELNSVMVRDTAAKVEVAEKLIRTIDKHRGEIAVDVEVLYLRGEASHRPSDSFRLSAEELERLRRSARRLASQELSVLDRDRGLWTVKDTVAVRTSSNNDAYLEAGMELKVRPTVHPSSNEVTLELGLTFSDGTDSRPDAGALVSAHKIESGVRLGDGETFLLAGLAVGSAGGEDSWLVSHFDLPSGPGEIVLALTPRVVRGPGFTESDLAAFCIGTDAVVGPCGQGELPAVASLPDD